MTQSPKRQMPGGYRLRVDGHLDDHWSPWFGDLTLTQEDDGTTSLSLDPPMVLVASARQA